MRRILSILSLFPIYSWANCYQLSAADQSTVMGMDATIKEIIFVRNDIFEIKKERSFWFHRFANDYHVITTEDTIRKDLLFKTGDPLNLSLISEQSDYYAVVAICAKRKFM